MTMYERGPSAGARVTVEFDGGISWIAHPEEGGQRGSHAIRTGEGVWLIDPLDAPNVGERIAPLGEVVGVAVCSRYHARDAGLFARRHGVSVHLPQWMGWAGDRIDAPIERYTFSPAPEFRVLPCRPFPFWEEVFWYHEPSETLIVPDSLGTAELFCLPGERLGLELLRRLQPPTELLGLDPARILVGHGAGITDRPTAALQQAIEGARRTVPEAIVRKGPANVRAIVQALLD